MKIIFAVLLPFEIALLMYFGIFRMMLNAAAPVLGCALLVGTLLLPSMFWIRDGIEWIVGKFRYKLAKVEKMLHELHSVLDVKNRIAQTREKAKERAEALESRVASCCGAPPPESPSSKSPPKSPAS